MEIKTARGNSAVQSTLKNAFGPDVHCQASSPTKVFWTNQPTVFKHSAVGKSLSDFPPSVRLSRWVALPAAQKASLKVLPHPGSPNAIVTAAWSAVTGPGRGHHQVSGAHPHI